MRKKEAHATDMPLGKPLDKLISKNGKLIFNLGFAVLLLIVAGLIYLYQKGHLNALITSHPKVAPAVEVRGTEKPSVAGEQLKSLEHSLGALQNRISTLETTISRNDTHLVRRVFLFQELKDKIDLGFPFESQLHALKVELEGKELVSLEAYAKAGVPSLSQLIADFQILKPTVLSREALNQATNLWGQIKARLFQLIHIEALEQKDNPFSALTDQLRRGHVQEVLEKTASLGNDEAIKEWRNRADAYVRVHAVLDHLKKMLLE